jgi:hypothetical protein
MKATYIFCSLLLLCCLNFTGCGQEQRIAPQPDFINLVPSDSIPFAQLPADMQQKVLATRQDSTINDVRVISNPFPDPVKLFEIRQLRCNMSESRVFFANRTRVNYDYTLSRPDILWEGALVNTNVNTGNTSDNYMEIRARYLPSGQYELAFITINVSLTERYKISKYLNYWILAKYNPSRIYIPNDAPPLRTP